MSAKTRFWAVILLICTMCSFMPMSAIAIWAEDLAVTEKEDAMQKIESDTELSAYKQGDTQTVADDGYIGIPVKVTVYYDYATHGATKAGYNGTPVILYVINSGAERIGTDSDTDIIKSMLERGYGRIINIASVAGVYGNAKMAHYSMTKGAVISFTKALAKEVADKGITVNAVSPGSVSGSTDRDYNATSESQLSFMGRTGSHMENAELICFIASDAAAYISGQNIQIDGCRKKM